MNDLEELRAFRDEIREPGHDRLAPGRERLMRAAAEGSPAGFRLPVRRLAVAGTALVALGAGAAVVVPDDGGTASPVATRPVSANAFLERAARTAEKQPDRRPGDHQWVYTKIFYGLSDSRAAAHEVHQETWTRFDGLKSARYEGLPGKKPQLTITDETWVRTNEDTEERTPSQWYDYVRRLPDDPSVLLDWMRKRADDYKDFTSVQERDAWVFRRLAHFLALGPSMPRSGRATVYRAIGKIPGVRVREHAEDALGRSGVAVLLTRDNGVRDEFILSPGSYRYLGTRSVSTRELTFPTPSVGPKAVPGLGPVPAGTTLIDQALETSGVVDRPGQRP